MSDTVAQIGPRHCVKCGSPFAFPTLRGSRCHLCELREWAEQNPVPLPSNIETVRDLAAIGYQPAVDWLTQYGNPNSTPSNPPQTPR